MFAFRSSAEATRCQQTHNLCMFMLLRSRLHCPVSIRPHWQSCSRSTYCAETCLERTNPPTRRVKLKVKHQEASIKLKVNATTSRY